MGNEFECGAYIWNIVDCDMKQGITHSLEGGTNKMPEECFAVYIICSSLNIYICPVFSLSNVFKARVPVMRAWVPLLLHYVPRGVNFDTHMDIPAWLYWIFFPGVCFKIIDISITKLLQVWCIYDNHLKKNIIPSACTICTISNGGSAQFVICLLAVLCFSLSWRLKSER